MENSFAWVSSQLALNSQDSKVKGQRQTPEAADRLVQKPSFRTHQVRRQVIPLFGCETPPQTKANQRAPGGATMASVCGRGADERKHFLALKWKRGRLPPSYAGRGAPWGRGKDLESKH